MAKLIVAITGTPGTGKSTFAKQLSRKLASCRVIEINSIAKRQGTYLPGKVFGSRIVNTKKLSEAMAKEIRGTKRRVVIMVGHLVPDLDINPDITIVLRLDLKSLVRRLKSRGYPKEKIRENLISEAVDYCGANSREKFKNTYEIDSPADKMKMISYIRRLSMGKRAPEPPKRELGRLSELLDLIEKGNEFGL